MKYKQIIQLPDRVSQSIFDLPCVHAIYKGFKGIEYTLFVCDYNGFTKMSTARPGDYIGEDHKGKWHVLTKEQGEELMKGEELL